MPVRPADSPQVISALPGVAPGRQLPARQKAQGRQQDRYCSGFLVALAAGLGVLFVAATSRAATRTP